MPLGSTVGFSNIDPATGQAFATPTTNVMYNFGWEYVWHCHLLGHEENDMMRPLVMWPGGNMSPGDIRSAPLTVRFRLRMERHNLFE